MKMGENNMERTSAVKNRACLKKFRDLYANESYELPVSAVRLKYERHQQGTLNPNELKKSNNLLCVAKIENDGSLSLVYGWSDYQIALKKNSKIKVMLLHFEVGRRVSRSEIIKLIVSAMDKDKTPDFVVKRTEGQQIELSKIVIPTKLKNSVPSAKKLDRLEALYDIIGDVDVPVVLDKDYVLKDGFARYYAYRRMGIKQIRAVIQ